MNQLTVFYDHIKNAAIQENMTIEQICEKVVQAGISGTEIDYLELLGEAGSNLSDKLASLGVPISCAYCNFNWHDTSEMINFTDVLSKLNTLGIHRLLVIPGFAEGDSSEAVKRASSDTGISPNHQKTMESFIPKFRELILEAPKYDIELLMEDYDSTSAPFGSSYELKWFMDKLPSIGCAFDTGNFYYHGEDAYSVLPKFIDRIRYVHCKDRSLTPVAGEGYITSIDGKDLYSSPVGYGVIRMTEIVKDILESGYKGPFAIEHFGSLSQLSFILESAKYLHDIIGKYTNC